jgi:hypothetical protein
VRRRLLVAALAALAVGAVAAGGLARAAGGPFYLVPSATKECTNVKDCVGVPGPWVVIPAGGEATFLFGCPQRRGYVVGGTDARVSTGSVHIWFDGRIGGPVGVPINTKGASVLLFHATANDGKEASFQPILGCVSLTQKNKRSTVSALPGVAPGPPVDLRAELVLVRLSKYPSNQKTTLACGTHERLIGSWHGLAFGTPSPPDKAQAEAVAARTSTDGRKVQLVFHMTRLFPALSWPRAYEQVGALCEPS